MKICPKCEGHATEKFCLQCGLKTIDLKCPECNQGILKHQKFCGSCGQGLTTSIANQINAIKEAMLERQT